MAHFHVYTNIIKKGAERGTGVTSALYVLRLEQDTGVQSWRYLERDGPHDKRDLVASGWGNLPQWANDEPVYFWQMADMYEVAGEQRRGEIARHYQIALPRELSPEGRLALAEDIRRVCFAGYPHVWAVHNPLAHTGGGENPHIHIMFSRRKDHGREVTPEAWFHRGEGLARKDRWWKEKTALQGVRHEVAVLTNAALEREGIDLAVSPDRLVGQGHGRKGLHYGQFVEGERTEQVKADQAVLRANGVQTLEQELNVLAWHQQKEREGIYDISREAMVDHCRLRFWAHDQSPQRKEEREDIRDRMWAREEVALDRAETIERLPQRATVGVGAGWEEDQGEGLQVDITGRKKREVASWR